ncbi:hypothetical protein Hsw_0513 [Hymenobacter swuensis DY53]|uniref:Uncharacterized protein n=1 Tax=Hymenobacter swuensis DY53 TaxID=1227739 RepID=W8EUC1_9BACT|nr:hypothetical protein Hsw_0513 [Hymenobacter swuensis DY53]
MKIRRRRRPIGPVRGINPKKAPPAGARGAFRKCNSIT